MKNIIIGSLIVGTIIGLGIASALQIKNTFEDLDNIRFD